MTEHQARLQVKFRAAALYAASIQLLRRLDTPGHCDQAALDAAKLELRHQTDAFRNWLIDSLAAMPGQFSDAERESMANELIA